MYKLLIVEDEDIIREGMKYALDWEALGIAEPLEAADGEEALALAKEALPDLVLTDVVMSGMDGIEFVTRLRRELADKPIRVMMISGHENVDYIKAALKLQVVDYLLKPFHTEELEQRVRQMVTEIRAEEEQRHRIAQLEKTVTVTQTVMKERFRQPLPTGTTDAELEAYQSLLEGWLTEQGGGDAEQPLAKPEQRRLVRTVTDYVQASLREELTLAHLAARVHLSPNHLAYVFKKETGRTLNDYITAERMTEAKRLLAEEPGILVTELAERVGYADSKYFTKLFKREVGLNPSEYRERL